MNWIYLQLGEKVFQRRPGNDFNFWSRIAQQLIRKNWCLLVNAHLSCNDELFLDLSNEASNLVSILISSFETCFSENEHRIWLSERLKLLLLNVWNIEISKWRFAKRQMWWIHDWHTRTIQSKRHSGRIQCQCYDCRVSWNHYASSLSMGYFFRNTAKWFKYFNQYLWFTVEHRLLH